MTASSGLSQFQLSYERSPIILNGGIAGNLDGGLTPIITLLAPQNFTGGVTAPTTDDIFADPIAHFTPVPGGTLIENQVGQYPFANQQVAANAIIVQPLRISLLMTSPAPTGGGYAAKKAVFTSLQQSIAQHCILGGTFTVATPAYLYENCLLLAIRDVSSAETGQVQVRWQWDFYQPLLTEAAAAAAQNTQMAKISGGVQLQGDPPGSTAVATGDPSSGVGPIVVPSSRATEAASGNVGGLYGLSGQGTVASLQAVITGGALNVPPLTGSGPGALLGLIGG